LSTLYTHFWYGRIKLPSFYPPLPLILPIWSILPPLILRILIVAERFIVGRFDHFPDAVPQVFAVEQAEEELGVRVLGSQGREVLAREVVPSCRRNPSYCAPASRSMAAYCSFSRLSCRAPTGKLVGHLINESFHRQAGTEAIPDVLCSKRG
jgi:hypothetical protein